MSDCQSLPAALLGGCWLAHCVSNRMCACVQDIEKALEPILFLYKQRRRAAESLGDFTARVGFDTLRAYSQVSPGDAGARGCRV